MLKHQIQGTNECLITSIAVLMGVDREQLLNLAREGLATNKPWACFDVQERRDSIKRIKAFYADKFPHWFGLDVSISREEIKNHDRDFVLYNVNHFRGAIAVACPFQGAHVAAYEYGQVFDSSSLCPAPIVEWLEAARECHFAVTHVYCDFDSYK